MEVPPKIRLLLRFTNSKRSDIFIMSGLFVNIAMLIYTDTYVRKKNMEDRKGLWYTKRDNIPAINGKGIYL